ncbi:helix-turn-helix domain-containing protein [Streptomyces sp. SID8361]|uniref:helix-turn-helix domain-containing protein n=1 Tax=Streptomyces sp. MnatMP-M27 TaxID=1839768 RepID=UPI00081E046B|nr:helix-turn-helix transcriptional regulator [Streptomyces sp. MnatMP-M27]MYU13144.1 helix-turn-helix domain-containing protein [Streptomyces sp. SID8361]SCF98337.1 Helix-turn-helix domain-containing protein [Streptomyces sp. MnatMP-M27]
MDSGEFSQRVRDLLRDRDMSVRAVARHLNYDHAYLSRVLSGKQRPSTQLVTGLDQLLRANGKLAEIAARVTPPTVSPEIAESPAITDRILRLNEARGADFAHAIRETSHRLVVLDNELSGVSIAEPAGRAFKVVHRRLGAGDYEPRYERDIQSAAAELAEVAGWALFDAEIHGAARRFNHEALFLANLSGDRSIALLTLQNMAMHSEWCGRNQEALSIARSVLNRRQLSPRVEAMFRIREAKGLVGTGRTSDAIESLQRARSLIEDRNDIGEPDWSWWVTHREIDGHWGHTLQISGDVQKAIERLLQSAQPGSGVATGYAGMSSARLAQCLLDVNAWRDAEDVVRSLVTAAPGISSERTLRLIGHVAKQHERLNGAPPSLTDTLEHLAEKLDEDPFTL